jgi:membrane dipeptidase
MKIAPALILLTALLPLSAQMTKEKDPLAVHNSAIVIDTHADTTQRMLDEGYDLADPLKGGYVNFESARQGNLGAEFFSIWVDPPAYTGHEARRTLELIDAVYQQAAKHPQQMRMAFSPEETGCVDGHRGRPFHRK